MPRIITDGNLEYYTFEDSGYMPRESEYGKLEGVPMFADAFDLIPESEWPTRIAAMAQDKAWPRDRYREQIPIHQNQNGLSFCWAYSLVQAVEMCRAVAGLKYHQLAPETLGSLVGWTNSGYYCDKALSFAQVHGIAGREFAKQYSLNSGSYVQGWQQNALLHRPAEVYDLGRDMWREVVTALLSGFAVYTGYNRFRHAITLDSVVNQGGKIGVSSPNTWNGEQDRWTLFGSVAIPDEAYAIRSVVFSEK
jgi:hypothetical protein